jgi:hypothetical protein
MATGRLLVALCCLVALFAARSEAHGVGEFTGFTQNGESAMKSFFDADKPEAAVLPQTIPAKPEAASAIPTTTAATTTTAGGATSSDNPAPPRRSAPSVAAGVACGVAAVAVVGVAAAVAYVVRARRGARRESAAVQLSASP